MYVPIHKIHQQDSWQQWSHSFETNYWVSEKKKFETLQKVWYNQEQLIKLFMHVEACSVYVHKFNSEIALILMTETYESSKLSTLLNIYIHGIIMNLTFFCC